MHLRAKAVFLFTAPFLLPRTASLLSAIASSIGAIDKQVIVKTESLHRPRVTIAPDVCEKLNTVYSITRVCRTTSLYDDRPIIIDAYARALNYNASPVRLHP